MTSDGHVVVVGASVGGLAVAENLRARGHRGPVTILGAEASLPYDRPALSKKVLEDLPTGESILLRTKDELDHLDIGVRTGQAAVRLDTDAHQIWLTDESVMPYDRLVIATGATPRTLPSAAGLEGVHTLRTLDNARTLRADLERARGVVVVGAGFIGLEVASAARKRGLTVTVIEALPAPMSATLGPEVGGLLGSLHREHGVDLRCGVGVSQISGYRGRVEEVWLDNGDRVAADVVVLGIGVVPETGWLTGSGIAENDGVLCDQYLRTSDADVFAVGDLARWYHAGLRRSIRIEHWTNAREQGAAVAQNIVATDAMVPFASVPYVWSDQHGNRIQIVGAPRVDDEIDLVADKTHAGPSSAVYRRNGALTAALTVNDPLRLLGYRKELARELAFAAQEGQLFAG